MRDVPTPRDRGHWPRHHGASGARGSPSRRGSLRDNGPQQGDSRVNTRAYDGGRGDTPVKQWLGQNHDVRHTINARRREYYHDDEEGSVAKNYRPRRDGHYDSGEDRSISPEPPGPEVFTFGIRSLRVPSKYRPPTNITKYGEETDPGLWLEDYRLVRRTGGAESDTFIIRNLPLYLADSARTWLEHLPTDKIACCENLREIFIGNFQGTYEHPGNSWDLKNCQQNPGESLRDYIRRFSKECNAIPNVADADVIGAFL